MTASRRSLLQAFAGLPVLLAGNYFLRHTLEEGNRYIFSFFLQFYPAQTAVVFSSQHPWWKLLLPERQLSGTWTTTTLILSHLVERQVTPPVTWYLFNGILVAASFLLSWFVFRSRTFSYTFAICLGFGTQLFHTYAVPGTIGFCLLFVYYELLLVSIYKVITAERRRALWWLAFAGSLLVTALAYEGWLDFLVFAWLASAYLAVVFLRTGRGAELRRLVTAVAVMTVVGGVYIYIKTHFGYAQNPGSESDVVFNYPSLTPAIEDIVSNIFTYLHIVITLYLPAVFVSSTALTTIGAEKLVAYQSGYHAPFNYLVAMHYVFYWRYYAGVIVAVLAYAIVRCLKASWRQPKTETIVLSVFVLMVAVGGPTHDFIKFRPMNSMPTLAYHAMVAHLGMALLVSYGLMRAHDRLGSRPAFAVLLLAAWTTIVYSALTRPAFLNQAVAQGGLGDGGIYPDPWQNLAKMLKITVATPAPIAAYRLERYRPPPPTAAVAASPTAPAPPPPAPVIVTNVGNDLTPLPWKLPPLTAWAANPGVKAVPSGDAVLVTGNDTATGYQLISPAVPVLPNHYAIVRAQGTVQRGEMCFGVLTEDQRTWLAPADSKGRAEIGFNTLNNRSVTVVLANCYGTPKGNAPTQFLIRSIALGVFANPDELGGARPAGK